MDRRKDAIKQNVLRVINGGMSCMEAAKTLGVSRRTIYTYIKKFLAHGSEGLIDHRRGHFRKIEPQLEVRIITCKLDSPHRSARWIRDRLKLPVSVETVRQVLVRYQLNHGSLEPRRRFSTASYKWDLL